MKRIITGFLAVLLTTGITEAQELTKTNKNNH